MGCPVRGHGPPGAARRPALLQPALAHSESTGAARGDRCLDENADQAGGDGSPVRRRRPFRRLPGHGGGAVRQAPDRARLHRGDRPARARQGQRSGLRAAPVGIPGAAPAPAPSGGAHRRAAARRARPGCRAARCAARRRSDRRPGAARPVDPRAICSRNPAVCESTAQGWANGAGAAYSRLSPTRRMQGGPRWPRWMESRSST